MRVLVTGASGFIGSHLTERLLKEGYEVACLRRKTSSMQWLEGLNVRYVTGDCCDRSSLDDCVRGYDYIFHLSGLTKAVSRKEFYTVNEKGTENIIDAVDRCNPNIKRFVYLSSLSAFGPLDNIHSPHRDGKPFPVSDYGKSKLRGEVAVMRYSSRIPVSILRPAAVYGPRDREFFLLFKLIKRGFMPYWGGGRVSLVYIDDLIDAIILAALKDSSIGNTYFISDGMVYSIDEIIDEIASALEVRVFKVRLPRAILPVIGLIGDVVNKMKGRATMINRDKIREIMHGDWPCDITKARDDLDFEPKIGIKKGMRWTAEWYRIHRWL